MVSPCVQILRNLATAMKNQLGTYQGTKHEPADLSRDIATLMASLKDHKVYQNLGRVLDNDDPPAIDVITSGLRQLTESSGNPLSQYNLAFKQLQRRCSQKPIVGGAPSKPSDPLLQTPPTTEQPATNPSAPVSLLAQSVDEKEAACVSDGDSSSDSELSTMDDEGPENGNEEDSEDGIDESELSDNFNRSMDDADEDTLTLDRAEDVELDMDDVAEFGTTEDYSVEIESTSGSDEDEEPKRS
jgi:hypothetical protein